MADNYLKYLILGLLGLFLSGCSEYDVAISGAESQKDIQIIDDKIILTTTITIPEFQELSTRSSVEVNFDGYELYLAEFEDTNNPLSNFQTAVYHAERVTDSENSTDDSKSVTYKVTINKTDQPRVLHLIAIKNSDLNIPYGPEASVIPNLTTGLTVGSDGSEDFDIAYWRRLEFSSGYCVKKEVDGKDVWEPNTGELNKLKDVKLVRNIAQISVGYPVGGINHGDGSYFKLKGFLLVNTPDKGTVAPYSASGKFFPEFLTNDGIQKPYTDLITGNQKYDGISAAGTKIEALTAISIPDESGNMSEVTSSDNTKWSRLPSRYMYERPFNSINHTYVIIYGEYKTQTGEPQDSYYKLDLGSNENNEYKVFEYYGILRNFNFFIRIRDVNSPGFPTLKEAAEGPVFNNISFDIDTDDLKNMSDGKNIIRVSFTTAVITENDTKLDFLYAFKKDFWHNNKYDNSLVEFVNLDKGSVIKDYDKATNKLWNGENPSDPYSVLRIECNDPTPDTKTQTFIIVNPEFGLGRTINLVSHLKWEYENPCEFAGTWENYPEAYKGLNYENKNVTEAMLTDGTYPNKAGTKQDAVFTIFFDIPSNIPEVLFPLEFTIESSYQGLDNNPTGTIVVSYGPTLFPDLNGEGQTRIQYIKTVTWSDYNTELLLDEREDNGTLLTQNGETIHRVRCRFRTSEEATNGTEIQVRIANDNFYTGEIKFLRLQEADNLEGPGLVLSSETPTNP